MEYMNVTSTSASLYSVTTTQQYSVTKSWQDMSITIDKLKSEKQKEEN